MLHVTANDYSGNGGGGAACCWTTTMIKVAVPRSRTRLARRANRAHSGAADAGPFAPHGPSPHWLRSTHPPSPASTLRKPASARRFCRAPAHFRGTHRVASSTAANREAPPKWQMPKSLCRYRRPGRRPGRHSCRGSHRDRFSEFERRCSPCLELRAARDGAPRRGQLEPPFRWPSGLGEPNQSIVGRVASIAPGWQVNEFGEPADVRFRACGSRSPRRLEGPGRTPALDVEVEGGTIGDLTLNVSERGHSFSVGERARFSI